VVPSLQGVVVGARFENGSAPETIEPDLVQSTSSQSLTEGSEAVEEWMKAHRTK